MSLSLDRYAIPPEHGKRLERLAAGRRIVPLSFFSVILCWMEVRGGEIIIKYYLWQREAGLALNSKLKQIN